MIASKKKLMFLVVFVGFCLIMSAPAVWGGGKTGTKGEPGANCPGSETIDFEYVPPPYTGNVNALWKVGDEGPGMYISGLVEQVGNSDCVGNIPIDAPVFIQPMSQAAFENLTPPDINGTCLITLIPNAYFEPCISSASTGYIEIVGAGNLKYTDKTHLTMNVVIMYVKMKY